MAFGGSNDKIAETEEGGSIYDMMSPQNQGITIEERIERISQKDFYRKTKSKQLMKKNDDIVGDQRLGFTQSLSQSPPVKQSPSAASFPSPPEKDVLEKVKIEKKAKAGDKKLSKRFQGAKIATAQNF